MDVRLFCDILDADFYTGVPDSLLAPLTDYLMMRYSSIDENGVRRPDPAHLMIGANEGNCAALAAGYHLATGKIPVVYLQNSGEGNLVNPATSLLHEEVYGIPVIFVVGWRGEPDVHDEPQHVYQGKITEQLLTDLGISGFVIGKDTPEDMLRSQMETFRSLLAQGKSVAFLIRKGALTFEGKVAYRNPYTLTREEAIRLILAHTGNDPVISTTGKASRELYEIRNETMQGHQRDFLTVGSMGHASSIALGIALQKPEKTIWCIDGDGAVLMHMGAMATIAQASPRNLVHIVIRNESHESVGGAPTTGTQVDFQAVAKASGYPEAICAEDAAGLTNALQRAREANHLMLIEVKCAIGARSDLGRPKESPQENKRLFINHLREC